MINIYTLNDSSFEKTSDLIPDFVADNIGKEGHFTLLAVSGKGEEEEFAGICQFFLGLASGGQFYGDLLYIYIAGEHRLREVGLLMVEKVQEILRSRKVELLTTRIPYDEYGKVISDISEGEINAFLKECGFIPVKNNEDNGGRYFKLTRG